ncbi:MAG: hypothetical protein FJ035_01825 [Chloroflexi bacterium]|nr:hypothetical protein [Chloroflexota bacterium]
MSWLKRGRDKQADPKQAQSSAGAATECLHVALDPHCDRLEDMGHEERAASFRCEACGREFDAAEGTALCAAEADRLRRLME